MTATPAPDRAARPPRTVGAVVLPPDPGSPARARHVLRRVLADAGRLDCLDAAELACTELVTNAVLHAHTPVEVTVEVTGVVRVGVRDGNGALPRRRVYGTDATTGRGLGLVAALTDEHGVCDVGPDGKTVWFTVGGGRPERTAQDLLEAWSASDWDPRPGEPSPAPSGVPTVRLLRLPSALWMAARRHHDALLRELSLYVARHDDVQTDAAATDRARFTLSGAVAAAVEEQRRAAAPPGGRLPGGLPWSPTPVDLEVQVPRSMARDFTLMQDALDTAERLARAGHLLTRPGLPEIVAVRDWACEQVVSQLSGIAPVPWTGADAVATPDARLARVPGFDPRSVTGSPRRVAAADDANRLVAVSDGLAALLGWHPDDLVGRRVVALIPARLREAHVAGFTRHTSTGQTRVLGEPLTVPVLRADGTELTCRLLLERAELGGGRAVFLAWIDPADDGPVPAGVTT